MMSAWDCFQRMAEVVQILAFGSLSGHPFIDAELVTNYPHKRADEIPVNAKWNVHCDLNLSDLTVEDSPSPEEYQSAVRAWLLTLADQLTDAAHRLEADPHEFSEVIRAERARFREQGV